MKISPVKVLRPVDGKNISGSLDKGFLRRVSRAIISTEQKTPHLFLRANTTFARRKFHW